MAEKKEVVEVKKEPVKKIVGDDSVKRLVDSMDKLTKRVDNLVGIFEEAAKHVSDAESTEAKVASIANKLDALIEQNKSLAKGLILLEKYVRGRSRLEESSSAQKVSEFGGI